MTGTFNRRLGESKMNLWPDEGARINAGQPASRERCFGVRHRLTLAQ
jgi:hypothetical protein